MPRPRTHTPATALAALAVVACLLPSGAARAVDGTCVGKGEYGQIKPGMTIQKLGMVLHGQIPFATSTARASTASAGTPRATRGSPTWTWSSATTSPWWGAAR